jgi:hypothetical protein
MPKATQSRAGLPTIGSADGFGGAPNSRPGCRADRHLQVRGRARARLNTTLADGIVAARHGWWQACPELDLPGYDALDANINLAIGDKAADPVSGATSHRCYPRQIERLA